MTPIPDDHPDYREEHVSAAESARRLAAAISGAIEGFVEAFEEHDVTNEAKRGIGHAGELARAATEETRNQAQTPEMQQVGGYVKTAGAATASAAHSAADSVRGAAGSVRDGTSSAIGSVKDTAHHAVDSVKSTAHNAAESVRENVENAKYAATRMKEEVKVRAEAVGETGRRARVAPGRVSRELRAGFNAWKRGLVTSLAMLLGMAVFATITLIVLTIALVVGLNALLGDPAGTFVVALLYLVIAGVAFFVAKKSREKAAAETARHMENSREEVRNVVRPVRDAFGRGRTGI